MKEEYKGFIIKFDERGQEFSVSIGTGVYRNKELKKVREHIKRFLKPKEKIPVIKKDRWNNKFVKAYVTSESEEDDSHYGRKTLWLWVTEEEGKTHSKCGVNDVAKDCVENWDKVKEILDMETKRDELKENIDNIRRTFIPYK